MELITIRVLLGFIFLFASVLFTPFFGGLLAEGLYCVYDRIKRKETMDVYDIVASISSIIVFIAYLVLIILTIKSLYF
jgi:predicted PurR-regulated permease PerM